MLDGLSEKSNPGIEGQTKWHASMSNLKRLQSAKVREATLDLLKRELEKYGKKNNDP